MAGPGFAAMPAARLREVARRGGSRPKNRAFGPCFDCGLPRSREDDVDANRRGRRVRVHRACKASHQRAMSPTDAYLWAWARRVGLDGPPKSPVPKPRVVDPDATLPAWARSVPS